MEKLNNILKNSLFIILFIAILAYFGIWWFYSNAKWYNVTISYCDCRPNKIEKVQSTFKPTNADIIINRLTVPIFEVNNIRELNVCAIKSELIIK